MSGQPDKEAALSLKINFAIYGYYQLPYGLLGWLARGIVRRKLEKLFDYRVQTLEQLFGR